MDKLIKSESKSLFRHINPFICQNPLQLRIPRIIHLNTTIFEHLE
jgi:hypothetical protein